MEAEFGLLVVDEAHCISDWGHDFRPDYHCLTTDEVDHVAEWLGQFGHDVAPYYGRLDGDRRRELEDQLMDNEVDALVATNALGMGFNKPDLGWVIHFQRPPNPIRYY